MSHGDRASIKVITARHWQDLRDMNRWAALELLGKRDMPADEVRQLARIIELAPTHQILDNDGDDEIDEDMDKDMSLGIM